MTTLADHELFDGDDVDVGEVAPDAEEMEPDEVAEMQAAIAKPKSPKSGVEAS